MESLTPKERMKIALSNGQPDRVPAAPDISNMIPCRLTGKVFWDIYLHENPPLWRAYLDAVKYFGMDGWFIYDGIHFHTASHVEYESSVSMNPAGYMERRYIIKTPDGDMTTTQVFPKDNPPSVPEKVIKNFPEDFKKLRHLFAPVTGYDASHFQMMRQEVGDLAIMGPFINPPGLQTLQDYFNGDLAATAFAYYEHAELFHELCEMLEKQAMQKLSIFIDAGVESILTGGSGSITLQSPEIWRELSLPAIQKITRMCKEAGVISGIHSCGKERYIVETCANETDLDYINPLEIPPMGDCDLGECKRLWGYQLALMGNLHTTNVMLFGKPEDVKRESLKAILAAGEGGGFVLSTGDQCGRDTPDENIFTLVQTAKEFGQYPLDLERINDELRNLR